MEFKADELERSFLKVGNKSICFSKAKDGRCLCGCICGALGCPIALWVTTEQAVELLRGRLARRSISEILPDTPPLLREMFITGITPAEFDLMIHNSLQSAEAYEQLGYRFDAILCIGTRDKEL